jgi:hypothetical protein
MGIDPITLAALATIGSTAATIYTGNKQAGAQRDAQAQAKAQADASMKASDEANNKINQKKPDTSAILAASAQAGRGGQAGTMLTGSQGVDPSTLQLGKSTLLGQ